ncbi:hypothetical protein ABW19_dt0200308 [Dactylella cylindrospora]|nr:hypothetical protein ABW19_dt0200308 [Dactylella cylindrospora]
MQGSINRGVVGTKIIMNTTSSIKSNRKLYIGECGSLFNKRSAQSSSQNFFSPFLSFFSFPFLFLFSFFPFVEKQGGIGFRIRLDLDGPISHRPYPLSIRFE